MGITTSKTPPSFWDPKFDISTRDDGTIFMEQVEPLGAYPEKLPERLVHWAETEPDRIYLAQRRSGGDWKKLSYRQVLDQVRSIATALLEMGTSPGSPLLILSENSINHALLGLAAQYIGLPYAPVAPAYSLVSTDHGKLRDITAALKPGLIFAEDGEKYAAAINAIRQPGMHLIVSSNRVDHFDATLFSDLLSTTPAQTAEDAFAKVDGSTIAKLLYTSGSTGSPKAVINTQKMLCSKIGRAHV